MQRQCNITETETGNVAVDLNDSEMQLIDVQISLFWRQKTVNLMAELEL
jgi:hypothetical protein